MLYNARDVAQRLGVARSTVWRLMDSGELPYVRFGRNRRVEARTLLRFIEKHRT
jgi:excisionase family DNA binding protein